MLKRAVTQTKSLFISAGHSDKDPGAVGNGLHEAEVVLAFRDALGDYLLYRGVEFTQDGERGENLPLSTAVKLAEATDVALEFHCNASDNPSANGVETLSQEHWYEFGNDLCNAIEYVSGISSRGAKPEGSGQHSRLAFASKGDGIIVELFFLSNKGDLFRYRENFDDIVQAVGDCIIDEVAVGSL